MTKYIIYSVIIITILLLLWWWYKSEKKKRTAIKKTTTAPKNNSSGTGFSEVREPGIDELTDEHINFMNMNEIQHFAGVLGCEIKDTNGVLTNPTPETTIKMKQFLSNLLIERRAGEPMFCANFLDTKQKSDFNFTA
jgi:hypothetical protein